jgi:hypothetical protein
MTRQGQQQHVEQQQQQQCMSQLGVAIQMTLQHQKQQLDS